MPIIDFVIITLYLAVVFAVGLYFYKKNDTKDDYYVGGRSLSPWHVGISVVATDVGGGFSIGLGGLGFVMGLSGTWLLFTGLVGAWLSAVLIIPKLKKLDKIHSFMTFPDFLRVKYNGKVALIAAIVTGIGYLGFTGGQILAGAKLASGTLFSELPFNLDPKYFSLIVIAVIILLYTALGGLKAVIYTDTVQWIVLLIGLIFVAVPMTLYELGGASGVFEKLPPEFARLDNVSFIQIVNWFVTIIPIWFIAMTLYQRMYACKDVKDTKKAWYIAGLFEYPIMAFTGVFLGMAARIYFPESDPEMGLPRLIKEVLPIGLQGLIIAAYFSAIMSTADSCLIASSGNFLSDIYEKYINKKADQKKVMKVSQIATFVIGLIAFIIAASFEEVLEIILHAYSFMVAALLVPTLFAYFGKNNSSMAALSAMLFGGTFTLILVFAKLEMPFGLDPSFWGILVSLISFIIVSNLDKNNLLNNN